VAISASATVNCSAICWSFSGPTRPRRLLSRRPSRAASRIVSPSRRFRSSATDGSDTPARIDAPPARRDRRNGAIHSHKSAQRSLSSCLESVGFGFGGDVDSDDGAGCWGARASPEPFRVGVVVSLVGAVALLPALRPSPAVDLCRGEQSDAAVAVLLVVPGHVGGDPGAGGVDVFEGAGVVGPVFHGAELRLGERVVVADSWPVVGLAHTQIEQVVFEQGRPHRWPRVGMNKLWYPVLSESCIEHVFG